MGKTRKAKKQKVTATEAASASPCATCGHVAAPQAEPEPEPSVSADAAATEAVVGADADADADAEEERATRALVACFTLLQIGAPCRTELLRNHSKPVIERAGRATGVTRCCANCK